MLGSKGEFNKNFFYPGEIVDSSCSVKFTEVFPHLMNKFKTMLCQHVDMDATVTLMMSR